MKHIDTQDIDALIARQTTGYSLDRPFYESQEIFRRDMDALLTKRWLLVDHESRVPRVGDYFLFEIGQESIIIIREETDRLAAHFNVCRHRGSRICLESEGTKRSLTCPYHGWTYNRSGALLPPPHMPEDFDPNAFGLHPCHIRLFHGFIFVCLTKDEPPDFDAEYAQFNEVLAFHGFENAKVAERRTYPNDCNWKLVVENFLECYHCAPAHKEYCSVHPKNQLLAMGAGPGSGSADAMAAYQPVIDAWESKARSLGHPVVSVERGANSLDMAQLARMPINDRGFQSETKDGKPASQIRMGSYCECDEGLTAVSFNPLGYILGSNDYATVFRFTPRTAKMTDVELIWLVDQNAKERESYSVDQMCWLWDVTVRQDKTITENNYAGIRSSRYSPGPYSSQETRVQTFIEWYLRGVKA